jgi:hypothetical protein
MASLGHSNYVVILLTIGGSKAYDIKLVLEREPRIGETWLLIGPILPNEEPIDVVVHELHEETSLTLTLDDLTLLSNNPVRVSLPEAKYQIVYVFSLSAPVPFISANIRSHAKLMQDVTTTQWTINPYGNYIVQATIDIDGVSLTPTRAGRLPCVIRRFELLHFGYEAQRETFR